MSPSVKTWIASNHKTVLVISTISLFIRLFLFSIPGLSSFLQTRFELATALTSYPRLMNCLYTANHSPLSSLSSPSTLHTSLTPYASDICTLPVPAIILAQLLAKITPSPHYQQLLFYCLLFLADLTVALCLANLINYYQIWKFPIPKSLKAFQVIKTLQSGLSQELLSLPHTIFVPSLPTANLLPLTTIPELDPSNISQSINNDSLTLTAPHDQNDPTTTTTAHQSSRSHTRLDNVLSGGPTDLRPPTSRTTNSSIDLASPVVPATDSHADAPHNLPASPQHPHGALSTCSLLSTTSFLSTASTITQSELQNEYFEAQIDYSACSAMLFSLYLLNPITLCSALAMNQVHISFALLVLVVYTVAMLKPTIPSLILSSLIHGLVILYDPMYLFTIPSAIAIIVYRLKNDRFALPLATTAATISITTTPTTTPIPNATTKNSTPSNKTQTPASPSTTTATTTPALSRTLLTAIYLPGIIATYILGLLIERLWASPLSLTLSLSSPSLPALLTTLLTSPTSFLPRSWYILFAHINTRPNVGTLWYFFIQIFDRFRTFYILILPLPLAVHTFSFLFRLHKYPLFTLSTALTLTTTLFHPAPTFQHYIIAFAFLSTNYPLFAPKLARLPFLAFVAAHTCVLAMVMWYSWIDLGSGNANFVFLQTIICNVALLLIVLEIITSVRKLQSIPPEYQVESYTPKPTL